MPSPYRPEVGSDPNDPIAKPNDAAGDLIAKYAKLPWVGGAENEANWRNYLTGPSGLNGSNTAYWEQRMSDAPGVGSNAGSAKTRASFIPSPTADLNTAGPQTSDTMQQIMEELQAQQQGGVSPMMRRKQMQLLGGV